MNKNIRYFIVNGDQVYMLVNENLTKFSLIIKDWCASGHKPTDDLYLLHEDYEVSEKVAKDTINDLIEAETWRRIK